MIAGVYNILCEQGATFSRIFTLRYPDEVDPEVYHDYDLSNFSARMQVRRTITTANPMIELTTENGGIIITNPTSGELTVYMSDEQTSALTSDGVYDIELINEVGEVARLVQGAFTLSLEVTR